MANVKKVNRMGVGHLFAHFERRDGVQFGNQEIDTSKSKLNYNLAPERWNEDGTKMGQYEFLESRMKDLHYTNKKDLNVMCSWVITLPDEVKPQEEQKFFKCAYEFLCKRYGEENVISAYVHNDETTPHMHFAFIPVVEHMKHKVYGKDEYTYEDTINAKKVISKTELQQFHPDLNNFMAQQFGRDLKIAQYSVDPTTGELVSKTKLNGNKTIKALKKEQIFYQNEVDKLKNNINTLKAEQNQLLNLKDKALIETKKATENLENTQNKINVFIDNKKHELEDLNNKCEMRDKELNFKTENINDLDNRLNEIYSDYNDIVKKSSTLNDEFDSVFDDNDLKNIGRNRTIDENGKVKVGTKLWEKIKNFITHIIDFYNDKSLLFSNIENMDQFLKSYDKQIDRTNVVNKTKDKNEKES